MARKPPRHTALGRDRPPSDVPSGPGGSAVPYGDDPVGLHEMLAALVESSDDAIVSKDLHGTIMSWNKAAERIFGYTAEEAISRPITMLLPADRFQEEATILATLVRGERIDHFETERIRRDGRRIAVSISVSPIKDRTGRIVGGAKIARDITQRKQLEQEREEALARERHARGLAESANRAKDAFLAMVSHELRSPLSPILAWARMLRTKTLDEQNSTRAVEVIERAALAQAQLIDDLLDVSRIASGKLRLEVRPVDLGAVVERAIEIVRPAADAKGIRLEKVLDTETGAIVGDPTRLQQVMWNLLSNAVKFTPKNGRVQITLERVNSHVEIAVSDTGQGMSAEFLPQVFERFQQAETGSARSHGGLGLGLAIVRHIVELHGGTVFVESAGVGKGATFTVKLPRMIFARTAGESERRHPTLGERPEPAPFRSLQDVRALVVDDEPDSNEVVSTILASAGADVRVAASAADGLRQLQDWRPHVIVSDIGMPGEDGYAFIAKVRAQSTEIGRIPVVALTAYASGEDRVRIFSAGFKAHIVKPIEPAELVAVIANVADALRP